MAMHLYRADKRGRTELDWLESYHSFSFNEFYDPQRMGFGALRVLNDDYIAPGSGFGTHPHQDMEIVTVMLDGAIEHRDSMGNRGVIKAGEVQRMSAGTGILHSERNASSTAPVHLLQIWVQTDKRGHTPSYEQRPFSPRRNGLVSLVDPGKDGALSMHQDARMLLGDLEEAAMVEYNVKDGGKDRGVYLFLVDGSVDINGLSILKQDAVAITDERTLRITALEPARVLLIDVPLRYA
jgi:hypothetical protein